MSLLRGAARNARAKAVSDLASEVVVLVAVPRRPWVRDHPSCRLLVVWLSGACVLGFGAWMVFGICSEFDWVNNKKGKSTCTKNFCGHWRC